MSRMPSNVIGLGAEGELGVGAKDSQCAGSGSRELGEPVREARPTGPVAVLVPPAIFEKEDAVLDLPMPAHRGKQVVGTNVIGADARQEVARVGQVDSAVFANDIAIDAQRDLTARKGQLLANVLGVV